MEIFENRRSPLVSIAIGDNPTKCVLNTLQFAQVETGQTSERSSPDDCSPGHLLPGQQPHPSGTV